MLQGVSVTGEGGIEQVIHELFHDCYKLFYKVQGERQSLFSSKL